MNETHFFSAEVLQQMGRDLCLATGSPEKEADTVAGKLVRANLAGHDSHGVIRLSRYMEWMRQGMIKPGAQPGILKDNGSTVIVTGNRSYGQVAGERAMEVAIERGRRHGIAAVGVTDLAHVGRLADYVIGIARAGMIGLMFTSTGGFSQLVAPFNGSTRMMSTNPIAAAFPSDGEYPIVMDMATSAYAEGKFRVFLDAGNPTPEMLLIDKEGRPTTDPKDLYAGGAILPLGGKQGYKGYLLNFLVEVLAGLLTGGGFLGREENPTFNNCSMMIAIDVSAFRELPLFKGELDRLIGTLKESPVMEGGEVLHPGELEARREKERRKNGIPLAGPTVEALQAELDRYGVSSRLVERALAAPRAV